MLTVWTTHHRAAVLTADRVVEWREVRLPDVGPGEMLVRVEATGICGSDLATYRGTHPYKKAPVVLGHELCGTVVRRGADLAGSLSIGDRVVSTAFSPCGGCAACRRAATNLCSGRTNLSHGAWAGSFAEHVVLRENMVCRVNGEVDAEAAGMAEPLSIALHAVRLVGTVRHRSVAVLGSGGIGLCVALVARHLGAGGVVCVDRGARTAHLARAAGADYYVDAAAEDTVTSLREHHTRGADITFVCSGHPGVLDDACRVTAPGGAVVVVSYFDRPHAVNLNALVSGELTVRFSALCSAQDLADVVGLLEAGELDPRPLITHRSPLAGAAAALDALDRSDGGTGKSMLLGEPTT